LRRAGREHHAHAGRKGAVRAGAGGDEDRERERRPAHRPDVARGAAARYKDGMLPRLVAAALLCAAAPVLAESRVTYTCPMHPEVHSDHPATARSAGWS